MNCRSIASTVARNARLSNYTGSAFSDVFDIQPPLGYEPTLALLIPADNGTMLNLNDCFWHFSDMAFVLDDVRS